MQVVLLFLKKYWLYIVGLFGVIIAFRFISRTKTNYIDVTRFDTTGSTIDINKAKFYADTLYTAMEPFGTDEDSIKEVYNVLSLNPANAAIVYNAFGKRAYGSFGTPLWSWMPSTMLDLKGWLKAELSGKNLENWNKLFTSAGVI